MSSLKSSLTNKFLLKYHNLLNKFLVRSGYISLSFNESKQFLLRSLTGTLIAFTIFIVKPFSNNILFLYPIVISLILYSIYPFLIVLNDYLRRTSCLYEDLRFLLISSSLTTPSFDLIKLILNSVSWKHIFNCIIIEAARLRAFTKWLTTHDALMLITEFTPSKKFKETISEYVDSLRRGTLTLKLKELSKDVIKELTNESKIFLNKSVSVIALSTVLLGFISAIVFALEVFLSYSLIYTYLIFMIFLTLFFIVIFPRRPYMLKINMTLGREKIRVISYSILVIVIIAEVFLITFNLYNNTKFLVLTLITSLVPLAVIRLYPFITGLRELKEVPSLILSVAETLQSSTDVINDLRNVFIKSKVPTIRSLSAFSDLDDLIDKTSNLRSWIARYTILNIYLMLRAGEVVRNVLLQLKDVVTEFISMNKEFLLSTLLPITLSVFIPWFVINMLRLSGFTIGLNFVIFIILQSFLYSLVTSKYIFDDLSNPILFILSLITLYILL